MDPKNIVKNYDVHLVKPAIWTQKTSLKDYDVHLVRPAIWTQKTFLKIMMFTWLSQSSRSCLSCCEVWAQRIRREGRLCGSITNIFIIIFYHPLSFINKKYTFLGKPGLSPVAVRQKWLFQVVKISARGKCDGSTNCWRVLNLNIFWHLDTV